MKKLLFLLLFIIPVLSSAQSSFSGIIKDSKTKQALPFATILTNIGIGEICDADGKFSIRSKQSIHELTISYVGYKTKKVAIDNSTSYLTVLLEPSNENLKEVVVVAKENPALQIIRNNLWQATFDTPAVRNECGVLAGVYCYSQYYFFS